MKLAVSGADTDLELAESMVASGTEAGESDFETLYAIHTFPNESLLNSALGLSHLACQQ